MEKSRPQLNLSELHQVRWMLGGLIGVLSAWTVFYMEVDALLALIVISVAVPLFTLKPRLSHGLPPWFHRLAFPVMVVIFALDWWNNREPLPAMIRLDLMLLGYRCVAPRGRREDLQLILLALFVVVVTGVFTVSIAFVAQILLFTAASLGLLLAVTISGARSEGTAGDAAWWERVRWLELLARLRQVVDMRVLWLAVALFGCVVGLSTVLFLALPRFEISNDFFLDRLITKKSMTGFSEDVRFDDVVDIQEDKSMAFAVDVSDPAAVPSDPYWRMLVLDEYSGTGFRMSPGLKATFQSSREKLMVHGGSGRAREDRTRWTIYFQPGVSRYLPLMGGFSQLAFGEPQALTQSAPLRLAALQSEPGKMVGFQVEGMDTDGILRDRFFARDHRVIPVGRDGEGRWRRFSRTESAEPYPVDTAEAASTEEGPKETTFLELKFEREEDKARLETWVAEIGGAGAGGGDFARRAGAWLQARHSYSLSMRLQAGEGDALLRWMASNEPGHCELFAGSLVLLSRAAGIPARLVTGFKGGVWNPTSGSITVRNSDAHAWVEIWDEEQGSWLRSDATPGAQITPSATATEAHGARYLQVDSGWSSRIDGLKIFWYRRIVNFDQSSQRELLKGTKEQLQKTLKSAREWLEAHIREIVEWIRSPWNLPRVAGNLVWVLGLVAAIYGWRRFGKAWWLGWRSTRAASHRADPVRREAGQWLRRLEHLERVRSVPNPDTGAVLDEARARLLRLRFGAREGWAEPARVFDLARRAARQVRKAKTG